MLLSAGPLKTENSCSNHSHLLQAFKLRQKNLPEFCPIIRKRPEISYSFTGSDLVGLFLSSKLLSDELIPVSAPGRLPSRISLKKYLDKGGRFVLREAGSGTRYYFDRFLRTLGLLPPKEDNVIVVNSFDALKHLVRGGYGISVISRLAVEDEVASGLIQPSRFTEGKIVRDINFIYMANENLKFAEHFIAFCKSRMPLPASRDSGKIPAE